MQTRTDKSLRLKGERYFNDLYIKQAKLNGVEYVEPGKQESKKATINWTFDDESTD